MFGCGGASREQREAEERELAIERERAQNQIVFTDENETLKNAKVVGNDGGFYKASPWEQERRKEAVKLAQNAPKPAPTKKDSGKGNASADKKDRPKQSIFAGFRSIFEDRSKAKRQASSTKTTAPAVEEDAKAKAASEYQRPKTIKKEDSVFAFANKFENSEVANNADKTYQSEFEKEREQLSNTKGVGDRQQQLETNEARMLMTDEFKVKVGLDKRRVNYQPRGGKVSRLQRDLAGSTAHFGYAAPPADDY
mmetsp:Transcript_6128/g.13082  ORF Transcript_6128/g.13082 Transcript_6128/m.13082 type:complete len:253 (+) Transcript_6128:42-800(+)